jgi:atlastin
MVQHPVQILYLADDSKLVFNRDAFSSTISHLESINPEIIIMTINGALRTGKSFLMNCILQYIKNGEFKPDSKLSLNGFVWQHGVKPDTMGMWMWGEPIKITDNKYLLLIDTQGIFDSNLNPRLTTCLFGLSTLISSVQIYNLEHRIQEDHLQHLELFTEYAKVVADNHKPFQRLHFLIRDWPNFTDPLNPKLCKQESIDYLNSIMNLNNKYPHAETTRRNIQQCYQTIDCDCLPHPSLDVAEGRFIDDFAEIRPNFVVNLNNFIGRILTTMESKTILSKQIHLNDVAEYMERYLEMLYDHNSLPEPNTIFNTTVDVLEMGIRHDTITMYKNEMIKMVNLSNTGILKIHDLHLETLKLIHNYAESRLIISSPERKIKFYDFLSREISSEYKKINKINNQKLKWLLYIWVTVIGIIGLIMSSFTNLVCDADVCVKISNFSYGVFLICILILILLIAQLTGLFVIVKQKIKYA